MSLLHAHFVSEAGRKDIAAYVSLPIFTCQRAGSDIEKNPTLIEVGCYNFSFVRISKAPTNDAFEDINLHSCIFKAGFHPEPTSRPPCEHSYSRRVCRAQDENCSIFNGRPQRG